MERYEEACAVWVGRLSGSFDALRIERLAHTVHINSILVRVLGTNCKTMLSSIHFGGDVDCPVMEVNFTKTCKDDMLEYSTIDEAWGSTWPPVRRKKKSPKPPPANGPLDEAAMRFPRSETTLDPWTPSDREYLGSYAEYNKEPSQRSDAPLPGHEGPERRTPTAVTPVHEPVPAEVSADLYYAQHAFKHPYTPRHCNDNVYDVILYIFTGILLILLLEQFIQIGMAMR